MRHFLISAALLLAALQLFTLAEVYYVTPTANSPCPEEGTPCFTLSQYADKPNIYFASNTTLILLPGNHNLDSEVIITGISSITIAGNSTTSTDASITCSQSAKFTFKDSGIVVLKRLVLTGCMNNDITSVKQFTVEDCTLQGQGRNGTGLKLDNVTNATIARSSFKSFTGDEIWHPQFGSIRAGGAIIVKRSTLTLLSSKFTNNTANNGAGGAVYAESSDVSITNSMINNNTVIGQYGTGGAVYAYLGALYMKSNMLYGNTVNVSDMALGGAVFANSTPVTMNGNTFNNNAVLANIPGFGGGAFYTTLNKVTLNSNVFTKNTATGSYAEGGAMFVDGKSTVKMDGNVFYNNMVTGSDVDISLGGALVVSKSNVTMNGDMFNDNAATASGDGSDGGAVYVSSSNVAMSNVTFMKNTANEGLYRGICGALSVALSTVNISSSIFSGNTGGDYGGALCAAASTVITNGNTFNNNSAIGKQSDSLRGSQGGAMFYLRSNVTMYFDKFNSNSAIGNDLDGGAMSLIVCNVTMNDVLFYNNSVIGSVRAHGAALFLTDTNLTVNNIVFLGNKADTGGVLYAIQSKVGFFGNTIFSNNNGSLIIVSCNVTFFGYTYFAYNSHGINASQEGGAVTLIQSKIIFEGRAHLSYNTAIHGGAISAIQSELYVLGDVTIAHNTASLSGGGIYAYQSELNLEKNIELHHNTAVERGGGIHAISSIIMMADESKTYFVGNYAKKGGGVCLEMNGKLYILKLTERDQEPTSEHIELNFSENSAEYGGALYITDDTNSGICHATPFSSEPTISSECFIQGLLLNQKYVSMTVKLDNPISFRNTFFINNTATEVGHAIYGGLLDRCTINPFSEYDYYQNSTVGTLLSAMSYIFTITNLNIQDLASPSRISSDPVRVCFCRDNQPDCSYHPPPVYVKKGKTFIVSLVAVDQVNNTISNSTIIVSSQGKLGEGQSTQMTNENGSCTELTYSILTSRDSEVLSLYAEGPCMDLGMSKANLAVYVEPCPVGFEDINQRCDCDRILKKYSVISDCSIDDQTVLRKDSVWFSYVNTTDHPHSYILHKHCPFDYCHPPSENFQVTLTIPDGADAMCAFNHTKKLCGSCKDGLSLSLGSSRCIQCSNKWLALLIVFAIAGVALVAFLLFCNFTVAAGTINGLLFYANIVSSNQATFIPVESASKFFTIFLAWLNLDIGFETCFFNGLDGYWKTWLQLAFPAYVIMLVILVIKACEYSHKFARLIARKNPVATLDTLVLLSYTKFLRTIISAWQFATLEYSDGTHEMVWLVDANIKYLESKHIPLFVAALVILMVALVYTLLLFSWQWLLLCPNRQPVKWIRNSRLHGIMDAYFITFNKNHRYWTGLLLLARVLLYLVSALNGMQTNDPRMNLLATILVTGSLILWKGMIKGKIYRKWSLSILDTSFIFNLLVLSVATWYVRHVGGNQTVIATTSISFAFIAFILIIFYHVYAFVLSDQARQMIKSLKNLQKNDAQSQQVQNIRISTENHDNGASVSVVDVPLIPMDTDEDKDENSMDYDTTNGNTSDSVNGCKRHTIGAAEIELEAFATADNDNVLIQNTIEYSQAESDGEASEYSDEHTPLLSY